MNTTPLTRLRQELLGLHKALIDSERLVYEGTFGPIRSPGEFLQLLTGDPWFAWLHALSEIIVAMDEKMSGKPPLAEIPEEVLVGQARSLLIPAEEGEGFPRHYHEALQRDPDVVLAHARVAECLKLAQ